MTLWHGLAGAIAFGCLVVFGVWLKTRREDREAGVEKHWGEDL